MIYHPSFSEVLASASEDCTIKIFDQSSHRIVASIEEHFKRVNGIEWIGDALLVSCSADKSVRVWMRDDDNWEMKCGLTLKDHQEEVVTVTCAQNGRIVLSASRDATLGCIDLEQGRCLERLEAPVVDSAYTCALFHPDGRIAGCGTETGDLHLWDIVQQKIVKSFAEEDAIRKLTFHENGHHMASTTAETIQLWDLRTMASFKCDTIDPYHRALLIHLHLGRSNRTMRLTCIVFSMTVRVDIWRLVDQMCGSTMSSTITPLSRNSPNFPALFVVWHSVPVP